MKLGIGPARRYFFRLIYGASLYKSHNFFPAVLFIFFHRPLQNYSKYLFAVQNRRSMIVISKLFYLQPYLLLSHMRYPCSWEIFFLYILRNSIVVSTTDAISAMGKDHQI